MALIPTACLFGAQIIGPTAAHHRKTCSLLSFGNHFASKALPYYPIDCGLSGLCL
jgi:hypothetical protein